ncbi:MAG: hypothetical protein AAGA24_00565 [Pseudomonadota bacterium]
MKRLISLLALVLLPSSAAASSGLAKDWGHRAGALYDLTTLMIYQIDHGAAPSLKESYFIELDKFSRIAGQLSLWSDDSKVKAELACIYRDMQIETARQRHILERTLRQEDRREALRRLAVIFIDAELVSQASVRQVTPPIATLSQPRLACAADPRMAAAAYK